MSEKKEGDDFIGKELTIYNSEYIMTTPLEKQEYIIYKMMYPGLYILAGAPKIPTNTKMPERSKGISP